MTTDDPAVAPTDDLADVAVRAVEAGGAYLADRFADGATDAEYTDQDVKTAADREAERRVLSVVDEAYPHHAVSTEERGDRPGTAYRWVIDPLDGTNNFAAGIPTFGVAVTVCERGDDDGGDSAADGAGGERPVATAVSVPVCDDVYVATRGGGVRYNGRPVAVTDGDDRPLSAGTVGMVVGQPVLAGGRPRREWDAVTDAVEGVCKRAIQTWAPVVYWSLFARGKLDGFVCYYPDEREQVAGELLARGAGAAERSEGPLTVFGADESVREGLWMATRDALAD
ncbi:inositol monophosphatase [Halobacteriales archaeon QS_4_69_31]|nr:MAG: inositol monophosphatase [Halobacteriales archaeon QS_4_69_31]